MFDVQKIRKDFPVLNRQIHGQQLVYLDSGATSQKPEVVIEAMNKYYRETNANINRGVYEMSVESTEMVEETRKKVAEFIGGRQEEVIFTRNTTESINLVAYAWGDENVNEGDAVVITKLEHHSNMIPWQELCRRKSAELRVVDFDKDGELLESREKQIVEENGLKVILGGWKELLDEKVKMVAITGQSNVLGTELSVVEISKRVKRVSPSAKVLIDGAQMVPHMKVNVQALDLDFLAFSGHKMLGPTGVGVLWGRKEILEKMRPFLYGGDMIGEVKLTGASWASLPNKFEAGTPDMAGIVGLGAAVDYLSRLGMDEIHAWEKELRNCAWEKMQILEKEGVVEMYGGNPENKGGSLVFNVKGVHAHDTAQVLDNFGIAVRSGQHCAAPLVTSLGVSAMVRVSFYFYNTKEEINYLVEKIREVPKVFV
ncbi:MAG TPA: SufS family cysteine desulfurase [Candidatus Woesebacteria bacterium]|nr:SufS family cysteine desulfurase [Candidatus Woesebacteria bacterium]